MNFNEIIEILTEEIQKRNRKELIDEYEEKLSKNIEELSKNENFFNLPLDNIFSVISKVDFNLIEENDKTIVIIQNIIKNLINKHFEEKETILILQNLNIKTISFSSYEVILSILELIKNCPILVNLCNLYKERNKEVDIDYEYELQQKEQEIHQLQHEIKELNIKFVPITEKPNDYEPNIFKACKEDKLSSVQWLIEKENEDKNKKVQEYVKELEIYRGDAPIHIASQNGHLKIVQYLIGRQNVDPDIKGNLEKTPLHYACIGGFLPIVEYLILKGANIEAKNKNDYSMTALHFASFIGQSDIVKYLISKGADKNAKTKTGQTPSDLAKNEEIRNMLK